MELQTLIQHIQKVELRCKSLTHQKLAGLFNSSFKGRGLALDSIRKYENGDDIRGINWNVTARFRETYVNTFTEDKERLIWILLDVSGSGTFGTSQKNKLTLAIETGATLAFSALENNDRVGVIFFSDKVEKLLPPSRGMAGFWRIAKELVQVQAQGKGTDITAALHFLMKISHHRSVVFLLSDFMAAGYQAVARVVAQQHELVAVRVYDEKEKHLPAIGWAKLQDTENGSEQWVNTASLSFQKAYSNRFEEVEQYYHDTFGKGAAGMLKISTGDDFVQKLLQFMSGRI
ncbi:DUF58 domain-containing protein [Pontibacter sp. SGAir0037]|uniref:DUF58 domain-containing protein n=1 Tax=Pontibacter sp. SGAir0037 TaxID=2571030 RepID=UPI0010CD38E3|nr:DUF58 domain-containing protein [Pontibacter sp. SGAir0037]QCR21563.1 DUF58 domain-containing protein [Pontibacter sp. SGAir0037]